MLREHCERSGATYDEIERSTLQDVGVEHGRRPRRETPAELVDRFGELSDAGAQHVIFSVRGVDDASRLELIGREVIPQLRDL